MRTAMKTRLNIKAKRVYESPSRVDGFRVLVDRLWPRGVTKARAKIDLWLKDLGPSDSLRKWFGHDPARWPQFKERYFAELARKGDLIEQLLAPVKGDKLTLVYSAKDEQHNQAVALKEFLERAAT
ncbi:MAG: hypothetical protein BIFFINMI_04258 [Phycisphaerae bacterium]|nr:hypothetical protein [Phycisphaerae bacterium]